MQNKMEISERVAALIREKYPTTPNIELADAIGCSTTTVVKMAKLLGVVKDKGYLARCASSKERAQRLANGGKLQKVAGYMSPLSKYERYLAMKAEGLRPIEIAMYLGVTLQGLEKMRLKYQHRQGNER